MSRHSFDLDMAMWLGVTAATVYERIVVLGENWAIGDLAFLEADCNYLRRTQIVKAITRLVDAGMLSSDQIEGVNLYPARRPSAWVRAKVHKKYSGQCAYCGQKHAKMEVDHIHPWARGGSNKITNLALSCQGCNRMKREKTLKELGWSAEGLIQ